MAVSLNQEHGLRSGVGACMLLSEYLTSRNTQTLSKYIATALLIAPLAGTSLVINGVNSLIDLKNCIKAKRNGDNAEASRLIQVIQQRVPYMVLDLAVVVMAALSWKTAAIVALALAAYHIAERYRPGFSSDAYMRFCNLYPQEALPLARAPELVPLLHVAAAVTA